MKNNRKLLKEAIADAKAVKETAIQNAKAALEEAFTPQLKSLLSQRLSEMEEEDENMNEIDEMDEYSIDSPSKKNKKYVSQVSETDETDEIYETDEIDEFDEEKLSDEDSEKLRKNAEYYDKEYSIAEDSDETEETDETDEIDLEELLAELEELDEDEAEEEEEDESLIKEEEEGEEEGEEEDVDIEALLKSPEDLKDFITDIVKDIMGEEGTDVEGEEEGEEEETEAKPIDEYTLDELLAELKSTKTAKKVAKKDDKKDKVEEVLGKFIKKISGREGEEERRKELFDKTKKAVLDAGLDTPEKWGENFAKYKSVDDIINVYLDKKDGAKYDSYKGNFRINGGEGNASLTWKKDLTGLEKAAAGTSQAVSITRESLELKEELTEAYSVINTLRSELNEVNLLNAKLLFTNKIFKNRSLTETQKVKVLTAFDKANSVKEAKLVYETLLENLKTTKSSVNESMGFASKAMGTSTKTPIVESNMMVDRFKKLAGII